MSALNRILIAVIGLATTAVGLLLFLSATGLAPRLGRLVGLDGRLAARTDPLLPVWVDLTGSTTLLLILAGAVVLAVLAVLWLLAQLPRRHDTRPLRLDARDFPGTAVVEPSALERAVEDQLLDRLGVTSARVELRGAASEPRLTIRLVVAEGADLPAIMEFVHTSVAGDLSTALQTRLNRLALAIDLGGPGRSDASVRLDAGAVPVPARE